MLPFGIMWVFFFFFVLQGSSGPVGLKGIQGPQGLDGQKGDQGMTGEKGTGGLQVSIISVGSTWLGSSTFITFIGHSSLQASFG